MQTSRPWIKWYKTAAWQRLRLSVLQKNPICEICKKNNIISESTEVDHKIDHKGDANLFYDFSNLWGLCKPCHSRKTILENRPSQYGVLLPDWMPFCNKPLFLIIGPPASGKNHYLKSVVSYNDLVLDLDELAVKFFNKNLWDMNKKERAAVLYERNKILSSYIKGNLNNARCWLIATSGRKCHIKFWSSKGAKIIKVPFSYDECINRIRQRRRGKEYEYSAYKEIRNWGKDCDQSCLRCFKNGCDENGLVEGWK